MYIYLFTLRSGEEGLYPDLISFCEKHIEVLAPNSRALRRDKPAATASDFTAEEWEKINCELTVLCDLVLKYGKIALGGLIQSHAESSPILPASVCLICLSKTPYHDSLSPACVIHRLDHYSLVCSRPF